ncbi:MAG: hypothetical protein ACI8YQ_000632 [Polaribacter sp.]|jgi:hypothetical protein
MKNNSNLTTYFTLFSIFGLLGFISLVFSCTNSMAASENNLSEAISQSKSDSRTVTEDRKKYWYGGTAEISSYKLSQARYGELHEGTAVLVYVTEPFSKSSNTKADRNSDANISVLKLNTTKKFTTGIYPYSIMTSTFFPFENGYASVKISSSMQEWCGMTYIEMKNKKKYIFKLDSYFEGESFAEKMVEKKILEDDLWSLIRLNPELLPVGEQMVIPALSFLRLKHVAVKAYKATISLTETTKGRKEYKVEYPTLNRTITINFATEMPNAILAWEESHYSGYGAGKKILTSKAELMKTVKTDYWNQNGNKDKEWREKLGL